MNKNEIKDKIREMLAIDISRASIFSRLSGQGISDAALAYLIASQPDARLCDAHRGKIRFMVGLMLFSGIVLLIVGFFIGYAAKPDIGWWVGGTIGGFMALIQFLFAWGFYKHSARTYSVYIVLGIPGLAKQLGVLSNFSVVGMTGLLLGIGFLGFVWYLQRSLFPDLVLFSARKVKGQYVFSAGGREADDVLPVDPVSTASDAAPLAATAASNTRAGWLAGVLAIAVAMFIFRAEFFPAQRDGRGVPPLADAQTAPDDAAGVDVDLDVAKVRDITEASLAGRIPAGSWNCRDNEMGVKPVLGVRRCETRLGRINGIPARMLTMFFAADGSLETIKLSYPLSEHASALAQLNDRYGAGRAVGNDGAGIPMSLWPEPSGGVFAGNTRLKPGMDHAQLLWLPHSPY